MTKLLRAIGLGSLLMYFFDPECGRRRRAALRERAHGVRAGAENALRTVVSSVRETALDFYAGLRPLLQPKNLNDELLERRIRARVGRIVSHPAAVSVEARRGRVTLAGPVLASELGPLLEEVRSVRGVEEVENDLAVHDKAEGVAGLQGAVAPPAAGWSPAGRFLAGAAGGVILVKTLNRLGFLGLLSAMLGGAVVLRALRDLDYSRPNLEPEESPQKAP